MKSEHGLSRRAAIGVAGSAALVASATWAKPVADDASQRLRALLEASASADAALDPTGEASAAVPPGTPPFVDPLSDAYATTLAANKRRDLAALKAIDTKQLGTVDKIAWDVLYYRTRQTLDLIDSGLFKVGQLAPLNPSFGPQVELPDFVAGAGARFASAEDYETGLVRLTAFAGYLRSAVSRLKEGLAAGYVQPKIIVTNIIKQLDAVLAQPVEDSPFYAAIRHLPAGLSAQREDYAKRYRAVIEQQVYPGYRAWVTYLRDVYLPVAPEAPGRGAMKRGGELYAAELAFHTTTTLTPDAIHTLGLSEVERITGAMEAVRPQLGAYGDLPALFTDVRTNPRFYCKTPDELLGRFRDIEARIWLGMPKLFANRPRSQFVVAALPALGEQRGTGYYRPSASGTGPGTLFFNMAMLNTRPIPTLETLTLHEGIPGHHFQINLARENTSLPPLLRTGSSTAYTEGWGLYAESLGRELGMFTDPWQWFGHLDMEMLRAVRLVVDTGIHARGWSRDKAVQYMLGHTSMAPRDVEVEIDRYIAYPAQACAYKVGELTISRLRRQASAQLGSGFDLRLFHDQVLSTGALPLAVLEAKIVAWLRSTAGAAPTRAHPS